ncbi:puratrophin-1-like isoform X2 [Vanacampus margaritifer]
MASPPRSYAPSPTPAPHAHLPDMSFGPSLSKETATKPYRVTQQTSFLPSFSQPAAFSLETRICPAKHGIAVSVCLVDTSTASSSRLARNKDTETDPKPIGWVSPNTWDSRFNGTEVNTTMDVCNPAPLVEDKGEVENIKQESQLSEKLALEDDYIDILQATMLFGCTPLATKEQKSELQMQPRAQTESYMQSQPKPRTEQLLLHLPQKTQAHRYGTNEAVLLQHANMAAESSSALDHPQSHQPYPLTSEPFQCARVQFSENPCTPCMARRHGKMASQTQELRCHHRESYRAALRNPVTVQHEKTRARMLGVVKEDGEISHCHGRRPAETVRGAPQCHDQNICYESGTQNQHLSIACGTICEESGEKNTAPFWRPGDTNPVLCLPDNHGQYNGRPELTCRTTVPFQEHHDKSFIGLQNGSETNNRALESTSDPPKACVSSTNHNSLPSSSKHPKPCEGALSTPKPTGLSATVSTPISPPKNKRQSDGRCSSLSTAVVDTSEKIQLVLVDGANVRKGQNDDTGADVPQLHVVKCKKSTAFQLISPKINKIKMAIPAKEIQRNLPPSSAHPSHRPDHLPLGSPDPRAHSLYQGVAALTGGRDRAGRAITELYGNHPGWSANVTSQELLEMLLYFHSIVRREIRESGMTLIFDARKSNPLPQLYKALMTLQEQSPQAVNSLLLLVDKESGTRPEKCPTIQTEVVTSMKALTKIVEESQRTFRLDGTLPHNHCDWMELHQKLFPFALDLHDASSLLLRAISNLKAPRRTNSVQTVQQCMKDQRTLMRDVLEDTRLVGLQREGGAILMRLRKESDLRYPHCEDLSDAVDSLTSLYNHVEEQVHILVQSSNKSLEHLEYLLQVREMEGHFKQLQLWFYVKGDRHLQEAESAENSGDQLEQILNSFTAFLIEANDRRHHAMALAQEGEHLQQAGMSYPETQAFGSQIRAFKSDLDDFLNRAEACGRELQIMVNVCDFCEQATSLAVECIDYLNQNQPRILTTQDCSLRTAPVNQTHQNQNPEPRGSQCDIHTAFVSIPTSNTTILPSDNNNSTLQLFQDKFLQFSLDKFQEVKAQASALRGSRGMRVWNAAWLRCQEARQLLQERLQDTTKEVLDSRPHCSRCCGRHYVDVASTQTTPPSSLVVQSTPGPRHPEWEDIVSKAVDLKKRRPILGKNNTTEAECEITNKPQDKSKNDSSQVAKVTAKSSHRSTRKAERETKRNRTRSDRDAAALSQSHTVGCQWFLWGRGLRTKSHDSSLTAIEACGSSAPLEEQVRPSSSCSHHGQPSCRILQEAQKFQLSRHGSFCSEGSCNRVAAEDGRDYLCKHSSLPTGRGEGTFCSERPQEGANNALRLQRVLEELLFTEREYVRSLGYILTHYLPLLDRFDIPQDLRGKRAVIFGNLQKLHDFHSHYFLPELEACHGNPAMVARCFLRNSDSFGLYALYSKNKPQSDSLILHRRHDIFKKKQKELEDKMDLSSYLLRPIQRISKYSLLLQDMLALAASCWPRDITDDDAAGVRDRERADIRAAADLVRFQMRHGNDLLTMDAIQDCDVNLKEQGRLIRQDEFTVFFRKKKCLRRIFLFEHLILFSKTKKTEVGNEVYVYKQSFKTSDIGMTHDAGVSGLSFEIWFRRRKSEDTYTLKASSMEMKKAWTNDLEKILWNQANHSRELRLQERVFMGLGHKTFLDIQPSEGAICDRDLGGILPGRGL